MSAAALKQYMELAGAIANQAEAIHEGKIPGKQLWAQVCGLENNIKTLKAWTPKPEEVESELKAEVSRVIYAYLDTVPEPIPADRWMWQTGNNWMAVAPFESEADWFMDLDERGEPTPTPRVRPIDDVPTSGTLTYMRADFTEVERPANGKKEES